MYTDALRDIIKDLVNLCGEEMDPKTAKREIEQIDIRIKQLENAKNLKSYDKMDLDVLNVRKEYWLNSASYLGNLILEGFENNEDKDKLISIFNNLFERAHNAFKELNEILLTEHTDNIYEAINKKSISLIKEKSKKIEPDKSKTYSNILKHYQDKKELIRIVIKSLKEKKIIVDETIELYQGIINDIGKEITENNNIHLIYNEKKYSMAYSLFTESDYSGINQEVNKLRDVKTFNESQLKKFNSELEKYLKEKETIEREIKQKEEELKQLENDIKDYRTKTQEGEYVSRENVIEQEIKVKEDETQVSKLKRQKNLLYVNLDKIREMGLEILTKFNAKKTLDDELLGEYTQEEIEEIKKRMELFNISKEEAIETLELTKQNKKNKKLINEYMEEFDFSKEEAQEALQKEQEGNKFWCVEEL